MEPFHQVAVTCIRVCAGSSQGPSLYLKPVPGGVVLGVVVLCVVLLLLQHKALKRSDEGS